MYFKRLFIKYYMTCCLNDNKFEASNNDNIINVFVPLDGNNLCCAFSNHKIHYLCFYDICAKSQRENLST